MRIVNIMFSKGGGGIEKAFVDYCEGLKELGNDVFAVTVPSAMVNDELMELGIETHSINNLGEWDIFAAGSLRKLITSLQADIVIAHANRAFGLARKAIKGKIPLVGVVQNYNTRRYNEADGVFTTTRDLINTLVAQGIDENIIFHIPNMIKCLELPHRSERNNPPVIGTVGRFVAKKGFDIYIESLKILKERSVEFKAVLGGSGEEEMSLKGMADRAGLDDELEFIGWVKDKKDFYNNIDIFCLPSLHEPFGIVLLEAFNYGVPVVATDSEGPRDIITAGTDALIVEKGSAEQLADSVEILINDVSKANDLAANAFAKTRIKYSQKVVCKQIEKALERIIEGNNSKI
ncbi:MAG: glycosyltransferase family 4 protein [Rickettsiales bacterium]